MVREVKFSCDELDGIELPVTRDRFDDGDDELLDGMLPENGTDARRTARGGRHLAGADWIGAVPLPRRRSERASA